MEEPWRHRRLRRRVLARIDTRQVAPARSLGMWCSAGAESRFDIGSFLPPVSSLADLPDPWTAVSYSHGAWLFPPALCASIV